MAALQTAVVAASLPAVTEADFAAIPSLPSDNRSMISLTVSTFSWDNSTAPSTSPSKSCESRLTSTVKSMVDLRLLEKKVPKKIMDEQTLPDHVCQLWLDVEDFRRSKQIMPSEMDSAFIQLGERPEEWWKSKSQAEQTMNDLERELDEMLDIKISTLDFKDNLNQEAGWNCDVHSRMLRCAIRHMTGIRQENVTQVRPDKSLIPKTKVAVAESKLVDFALLADHSLVPAEAVEEVLSRGPAIQSVNHVSSAYSRLRTMPMAVSIETKTPDGKESNAIIQLSL